MRFVLAPDSFKESMTAKEAAEAMERGIKKVMPSAECIKVPMADGGEGTVQSLVDATNGKFIEVEVTGPDCNKVKAIYGILGDGKTAVIEMASASGIHLIKNEKRNPLYTTTYGTGELIKSALDKGVQNILIGIGGSATNDGGAGMLEALGAKFYDKEGNELAFGGAALEKLYKFDLSGFDSRIEDINIEVACDVNNPLTGKNGASYIFGPQKGATHDMVERLDDALSNYAKIIKKQLDIDVDNIPGAGAAGGLGAGLMAFLNADLKKGIELVIKYTKLEEKIQGASYVFTGEGSVDSQTVFGKTPFGVATVAKKFNVPVIAFAGRIGDGVSELYDHGINSIIGILQGSVSLEKALKDGSKNIEKTSENIVRILNIK
ncbi:glycerate kinase [Clostridium botulinum]|uniref:Glycerate kinase n=1 Tax=Clostridium botulinum C/D str. DC5 TaxID=1443128 RepID=A0A0A0I585_CLOBO|nr:glycerate kinase [Clostridium botulinum]KEI00690.1 glycerate kinase [Clostridium botulinum C/D str. BKT75002]KEI08436.1 glycerate kinase [Clostridium botulinum C/D str. BKT2873]KGM96012.1 glycerate kinase [Clostridium botulinum C/D str. DC5]KGM98244.1 glycerate kinase [Clostridium botulinum D str. CCUG 7971]KOC50453.1 glycerate kinase [Clostridium botulinum]